eukprot:2247341-Pyramimonas_sp.AAC.1
MAHPPSRPRFPRRCSSKPTRSRSVAKRTAYTMTPLRGGAPPWSRSITSEASSRSPPCRICASWPVACSAR